MVVAYEELLASAGFYAASESGFSSRWDILNPWTASKSKKTSAKSRIFRLFPIIIKLFKHTFNYVNMNYGQSFDLSTFSFSYFFFSDFYFSVSLYA